MKDYVYLKKAVLERKIVVLKRKANKIENRLRKINLKRDKYDKEARILSERLSSILHMQIAGMNGHIHSMNEQGVNKYKVLRN
jgi:hypothetical protein